MARIGTTAPVTFTASVPAPLHFTSSPQTFTAQPPTYWSYRRIGSALLPTRLGKCVGNVIVWLGPTLSPNEALVVTDAGAGVFLFDGPSVTDTGNNTAYITDAANITDVGGGVYYLEY